jgi:hypothetical protein
MLCQSNGLRRGRKEASMLRKTMIVLAKAGAALLCTLDQGLVSR